MRTRYLVLGHRGMVGSAICRQLAARKADVWTSDGDLRKPLEVQWAFNGKPAVVFVCAGRVGGIGANISYPATFIYDNIMIAANVINAAFEHNCAVVYFGSSCIYPRKVPQPIPEEALLSGPLEPTNEAYAVAKIAGIQMLKAYWQQHGLVSLSLMPCNLYGPGDTYDTAMGHVLPSLIRKFVEAKRGNLDTVTVWGSGRPRREFMHVDDLAAAALHLVDHDATGLVNVGTGVDWTILTLAEMIQHAVGYEGRIVFDTTKPDGIARKLLDVSKLVSLGWPVSWNARPLRQGIAETVTWYLENHK